MRTIQRDIVSALIFSKDHKLLLVKKQPNGGGVYIDCWHIPGGGIDAKEEKIDALKREIMEEVGIDISSYAIELVSYTGRGASIKTLKETNEQVNVEMHFNVYEINITDKEHEDIHVVLEENELSEYQWVALKEISSIKLTPPSVALFKKLGISLQIF